MRPEPADPLAGWSGAEFFGSDQHPLAWKRETLAVRHHVICSMLILRAEKIGKRLLIDAQEGVAWPCTLTERAPRAAPPGNTDQTDARLRTHEHAVAQNRSRACSRHGRGRWIAAKRTYVRNVWRSGERAVLQPMRTAMARRVQTAGIRHSAQRNSMASDEDPLGNGEATPAPERERRIVDALSLPSVSRPDTEP